LRSLSIFCPLLHVDLVHYCTAVSVVPMFCGTCTAVYTAVPLYNTAVTLYRCTAVPLYRCTVVPVYRCTVVPMYRCTVVTVPIYRCTGVPEYQCTAVPLYRCTGVPDVPLPLYRCTTVPLYLRTGVPLHCKCTAVLGYRCAYVSTGVLL